MSWAKLDDQYPDHPKIIEVGPLGMALHTAAICYCARYLTNGFIPTAMISRLISLDNIFIIDSNSVSHAVSHKEITEALVKVNLLETVPGGYMLHDYLIYNPSGAEVKRIRDENAKRQAEWRKEHREDNGKFGDIPVSNDDSNALYNTAPSPSPSPSPIPVSVPAPVPLNQEAAFTAEPYPSDEKNSSDGAEVSSLLDVPIIKDLKVITGYYPPKILMTRMEKDFKEYEHERDYSRLKTTIETWVANGWNPTNYRGMLYDQFREHMHYLSDSQRLPTEE
jgi:hypothetical protein